MIGLIVSPANHLVAINPMLIQIVKNIYNIHNVTLGTSSLGLQTGVLTLDSAHGSHGFRGARRLVFEPRRQGPPPGPAKSRDTSDRTPKGSNR